MTPDAAMDVIEQRIEAGGLGVPIAYPNIQFTPPATGNWAKVDVIWGNGSIITKDGRNSITAVLQLALFGPKDIGDGALSALAETARGICNRDRLPSPNQDIVFGAASGPVPRFEESWRSLIVSVPFQVFETA